MSQKVLYEVRQKPVIIVDTGYREYELALEYVLEQVDLGNMAEAAYYADDPRCRLLDEKYPKYPKYPDNYDDEVEF